MTRTPPDRNRTQGSPLWRAVLHPWDRSVIPRDALPGYVRFQLIHRVIHEDATKGTLVRYNRGWQPLYSKDEFESFLTELRNNGSEIYFWNGLGYFRGPSLPFIKTWDPPDSQYQPWSVG